MMWNKAIIEKIDNGYIVHTGKYVMTRKNIFVTFDQVVRFIKNYYEVKE